MNGPTIRRGALDALFRRLPIHITDPHTGAGVHGRTFSAGQITISRNGRGFEVARGHIEEIGQGWYSYTLDPDEVAEAGTVALSLHGEYPGDFITKHAHVIEIGSPEGIFFTTESAAVFRDR